MSDPLATLPTAGAPHHYVATATTVGFLTDVTLCIGCKACEVACREWNGLPAPEPTFRLSSYDHTEALGANTWRHVKFLELDGSAQGAFDNVAQGLGELGLPSGAACRAEADEADEADEESPPRWLFYSDVCKHCEHAGCLDACPTGAIVRTEVGSVLVQDDICNGCGYCVVSCPFGVIDRRTGRPNGRPNKGGTPTFELTPAEPAHELVHKSAHHSSGGQGGAHKCTFCYDRQQEGRKPACAQVCPTESIAFGPLDSLRERAGDRLARLAQRGVDDAFLYDASGTGVGSVRSLAILIGEAGIWGLPKNPQAPRVRLGAAWRSALFAGGGALLVVLAAFRWATQLAPLVGFL